MFAAALIVFREVLEAALIVTIVMAATRGLPKRGRWISLGIASGIAGACLVAALTSTIASSFEGSGQEIVNAAIMFIAVLLIGWHVIWMNSHGRQMAKDLRKVGQQVSEGKKHLSVLATVVGLAVMREGSEVVLLLQGLWASGAATTVIGGALIGLVAGITLGGLMYAGLLALPLHRVFSITNGLLVLIAAGMAARGANFLAQADLIPSFGHKIWDSSSFVADQSVPGQFLGALIGYIARPTGIEILFYVLTVAVIVGLMLHQRGDRHNPPSTVQRA